MRNDKKKKEVMLAAIKKAGASLKKDYYTLKKSQIRLKSKRDIVTSADLKSEKIIIKIIKERFPDHAILSEEAGLNENTSDYFWIIDPLDGTTNFSFHNPIWSVAIALAYKNEIILGAVYIPLQDELFFAEKNKGAYLNDKKIKISNGTGRKINTFCHGSDVNDLKRALKYYTYQKLNSLDCRQLGSAECELAYVAAGRVNSLLIPGAKIWDMAAGSLLVTEAGGKTTNFKNKAWSIKEKDIVAAGPDSHKQIMKIIKKIKL